MVVVDKYCSKSGDGFHNWNLDLDLDKVVCKHCGEFYNKNQTQDHKHVYI